MKDFNSTSIQLSFLSAYSNLDLKLLIKECVREVIHENHDNENTSNSSNNKEFLSIDETSLRYGIPKPTLYTYNSKKVLPFYKFGKRVFYKIAEIENFIKISRRNSLTEIKQEAQDNLFDKKRKML